MATKKHKPPRPVRVGESLSFLLNKLAQLAGRRMSEALAPLGVQPRESGILAAVAQFGPMSQQRLGEVLAIDRTTMVLSVDRLEELSLVQRTLHPEDRRVFLINLTEKGRVAVPDARRRLEAFEADLLSPLAPREQRQFRDHVARLVRATLAPEVRSAPQRKPSA